MSDWYIANAKDMQWFDAGKFGFYSDFQQGDHFEEFGFNIRTRVTREDFLPGSRSHEARGCHSGRAVRDAGPRALVV